jgi:hypothetical protein
VQLRLGGAGAQQGGDDREQFLGVDRVHQVGVGAGPQPGGTFRWCHPHRTDLHQRDVGGTRIRAQPGGQLQAVCRRAG